MPGNPLHGRGPFVRRSELRSWQNELPSAAPGPGDSLKDACWIRNQTEDALPVFSVVQIGAAAIGPEDDDAAYQFGDPCFDGDSVAGDATVKIAVVQEPAATDGSLVKAKIAGATRVRLTGEAGKGYASPKAGETTLEAADSGPCVILYDPGPGDGERIAWVRIGGGSGSGGGTGSVDLSACGCGPFIQPGQVEFAGIGKMPAALVVGDPFALEPIICDADVGASKYVAPPVTLTCPTPPEGVEEEEEEGGGD